MFIHLMGKSKHITEYLKGPVRLCRKT